ncbi:MAG: hypothetical protein ACQKBU_04465 [Verrucomicrobiales bacterium]
MSIVHPERPDQQRASIIEGLDRLLARQVPGEQLSRHAIARECGCSHEAIRLIEESALRKLRRALSAESREMDGDFAGHNSQEKPRPPRPRFDPSFPLPDYCRTAPVEEPKEIREPWSGMDQCAECMARLSCYRGFRPTRRTMIPFTPEVN